MGERRGQIAAGLYVALAGSLVIAGAVAENPLWYLAAVVVTLPTGLIAFVGVYVGYALIQALGGLFVSTTTADGGQAPWLRDSSAALNAVLFMAAAFANLAILRHRRRARAGRRRNVTQA